MVERRRQSQRAGTASVIPKERFLTAVRSFARPAYVDQRAGARGRLQGDPEAARIDIHTVLAHQSS